IPDGGPIVTGTFKPSSYDSTTDTFPAPAPSPSAATALAVFNGTNPAGSWKLWVRDDAGGDVGSISGGWSLTLTVDGNDNNPCTDDGCLAASGCFHNANDANPCSDGNPCTRGDACMGGTCVPGPQPAMVQFCNPGGITINDSTTPPTMATPYPATV